MWEGQNRCFTEVKSFAVMKATSRSANCYTVNDMSVTCFLGYERVQLRRKFSLKETLKGQTCSVSSTVFLHIFFYNGGGLSWPYRRMQSFLNFIACTIQSFVSLLCGPGTTRVLC